MRKWQIANMILSLFFIFITILFSYLIEYPIIILIIIPIIIIITYYEQKANVSPTKYSRFIYILSIVIVLGTINFWIIPSFIDFYPFNIQVIVFCISFYLLLQYFIRYEYFKKESVIIAQHILSYLTFIVIAYSFFPILSFEFSSISNESAALTLNVLAHILINLLVLLSSLYYLYLRHLKMKSSKVFNLILLTIFLLIELNFYAIINLLNFYRIDYGSFIQFLFIGLNLIPIIFLGYVLVNFILGIIPEQVEKKLSYILLWIILSLSSFSIIFVFYTSFQIVLITILIFSVISQLLLTIGWKFTYISEISLRKLRIIILYAIYLDLFVLTFTPFFDLLQMINFEYPILFSIYFSLLIIAIIHNICYSQFRISKLFLFSLNVLSLLFTTLLIFLFCMFFTSGTYYSLIIPVLFSCLFLFIALFYIKSIVKSKILLNKLIFYNLYIVSALITSIPYFITFEMVKLGYTVDFLSPFNFSLYILYFILALLYIFSRNLSFKEDSRDLLLKIQVGIEVLIAFTTIFYYPYLLLRGTTYQFILPILFTSAFAFLPLFFSYKKRFFPKIVNKYTIIFNVLILWGCIISLPSFVAMELTLLGFVVDLYLVVLITGIIVFAFLLFLNNVAKYLSLTSRTIEIIKMFQLINWMIVCVLSSWQVFLFIDGLFHVILLPEISIAISVIFFLLINLINLPLLESFKQIVFENRKSRYDYYKIYKIYEYNKNVIYFGLIFAISFLISLLPRQFGLYSIIFIEESFIFPLLIQIAILTLFSLLLMHIKISSFKIEFVKVKLILEMICWFCLKIIICLFVILFSVQISVINRIFLGVLVFSILSPISVYYLNEKFIILEPSIKRMKQGILALFLVSIISFFAEFYWLLYFELAIIAIDQLYLIINSLFIVYLYLNFTTIHYKHIIEEEKSISLYKFFGINILLLSSVILINSIFFLFFLILLYSLILYNRNRSIIFRLIMYLALSIFCFNEFIINFDSINFLKTYSVNEYGLVPFLGLASIMSVLTFSIIINSRGENFIESRLLYVLISLFSYISFITFTSIAQIYSVSLSASVLLLFLGITLHLQSNAKSKWYIGLSILVLIFDFVLFLSETIFFTGILFQTSKTILSYTLAFSITEILLVLIFKSSSGKLRKYSFYGAFGLLLATLPTFTYFFLISLFALPLFEPIIFIISVDVFILVFYLSIATYQKQISWQVWRTGWWLWILCPVANFYIIYESLAGIDLFTSSLSFFGLFNINGSFIVALMICIVISLPFWYSWIKKHFSETLFIVWGLSLFALYWLSQNIFASNIFFTNFLFVVFAVFLLIPILFWMKLWKLFSISWAIFSITVISFLIILFNALGFLIEMNYSLNIIISGGFLLIASFFPTLRAQKSLILIFSYAIVIIGTFLSVFYINYFIFLNIFIALAMSLIIIGASLFTSRIFKLNQFIFNTVISIALISGLSLLTYSTFSLIPNFELGALFLTMTVGGLSFFVFNHFKMLLGINKIIPLAILSLGLSLSLSSFVLAFLPGTIFLAATVFISINIAFFYFVLYELRYVLLYLIPIPISTFFLEFIGLIEIFRPLIVFILIALMLYTTSFQLILNILNPAKSKSVDIEYKGLLKIYNDQKRIRVINFSALVLNSTYFSLFITLISPLSLLYQILEFLIVWSVLILFSLRYFRKWNLDKEFIDLASIIFKFSSIIAVLLYFELAFLVFGILLEYFLLELQICILMSLIFYFLLSLLDIYVIKRGHRHLMHLFNIADYILITIFLIAFLNQFLFINTNLLLLIIILILLMQFYTNYGIFSFLKDFESLEKTKLENMKEIGKNIITNLLFLAISLYGANFITNMIQQTYPTISIISLLSSYIMIFSIFMYIFNMVFKTKYQRVLTSSFFITFQILLAIFWISLFSFLDLLTLYSFALLLIIETIFTFYSVNLIDKLLSGKIKENLKPKIYVILSLLVYFEFSFLVFSIAVNYLDVYGSLLSSQIALFILSLFEIERMKTRIMLIIRLMSYFTISLMLLVILSQFFMINLSLLYLGLAIFTLMQFYSNYLYYKIRKEIKPGKESIFLKWKKYRQRVLGISFYILLIVYTTQVLIVMGMEFQLILFIDSLIAHILMLGDSYLFKFLGKYANIFVLITWGSIFGFSFLYFITWITIFSYLIIPVIILLLLLEITYLNLIIPYSKVIRIDKNKIKKFILYLYYLNFVSWPLFYINLNIIQAFNVILLSLGILSLELLIDKRIKTIPDKIRKWLIEIDIICFGAILSLDIFLFLEFYVAPNFSLNISLALLVFMLFMGYVIKPLKRKKIISFLYWTSIFILLSLITYNLTISGFSWGFLIFGIILYPFIFMLEELKIFIANLVTFIKTSFIKIKNAIITLYYSTLNFIKRNFKYVKILISLGIGILIGLTFSEFGLGVLNIYHSVLLTLAIFGMLFGLIPSKKVSDPDDVFEQKMKRFITIWISTSLFIYVLLLPYIESFLYSLILMTSSILGLSAIVLIFIYRKEKKQKISIKWRFYTTIISIILVIIWIILIVFWYFTEVRI